MFIKRTTKRVKGKTYVNHLLVESVATPKGPRHKVVCSLGSLKPAPKEHWLTLACKLKSALAGPQSFFPDPQVAPLAATITAHPATATRQQAPLQTPV